MRVATVKIWNEIAENLEIYLIDSQGVYLYHDIISTVLPVIEISPTFTGPQADKVLAGYVSSGTYVYANETAAKDACKARVDCNGVTRQTSRYTLRAGTTLTGSSTGEVSWKNVRSIRKVRVSVASSVKINLKEVQVLDQNGVNVAQNKTATQSSTFGEYSASYAVNGNPDDAGSMTNPGGKYLQLSAATITHSIQCTLTCVFVCT